MELQKFIICTFKNHDGSTYEGSPITKETFDSASFRSNYETKIKKARVVSFDSDEYLTISGMKREHVDMLKPKPQEKIKEIKVEKFDFSKVEDISKVESPVATKRAYKKRTGKTAVKV